MDSGKSQLKNLKKLVLFVGILLIFFTLNITRDGYLIEDQQSEYGKMENISNHIRIEERFTARRDLLDIQCVQNNDPNLAKVGKGEHKWPIAPRKEILIDEKSKLMGCLVFKAGSSSWHKLFWNLRYGEDYPVKPRFGEINMSKMRKVTKKTWIEVMNSQNWIRFIAVRHPLARLYSAWNGNLRRDTHGYGHIRYKS